MQGTEVALPDHFHDEDQLTFVMRGERRFVMAQQSIRLRAGEGACIPAGTPHRSLPQPLGVVCVNVYLPSDAHDTALLLARMTEAWRRGASPLDALDGLTRIRRPAHCGAPDVPMIGSSVQTAAYASGMTREGYSRAFRRSHGMSPQAFGIIARLNDARRFLRDGAPPAQAAAMSGFADQSHLGRCFRRAFGISPGRYRTG